MSERALTTLYVVVECPDHRCGDDLVIITISILESSNQLEKLKFSSLFTAATCASEWLSSLCRMKEETGEFILEVPE